MIPFSLFDEIHIPYKRNVQSATMSSIRAGGSIDTCIYPRNISELIYIVEALHQNGIKYVLLGNCTNTLVRDEGFDGVGICLREINDFSAEKGAVEILCGTTLAYAIRRFALCGIDISAPLSGVPGTLGAMVAGNSGCFDDSMSELFISCLVYDPKDRKTFILDSSDMDFGYRSSSVQKNGLIVLKAKLRTKVRAKADVEKDIFEYSAKRRESQPKEPSLGSYFKRPTDSELTASQLIDRCGLKGTSVGDAEVSPKHAGFIINRGCARANDVLTLAEAVKARVYEKFSIRLKEEVVVI